MKKLLPFLTSLLLFLMFAVGSVADEGFTYTLARGEEATITGFTSKDVVSLDIPSEICGYPVTSISSEAFADLNALESVSMPGRVTQIAEDAFGKNKPVIKALNGSAALKYAAAHGLKQINLSEMDFYETVIDFTDAEWSYNGRLIMPAYEGRRLSEGCIVFLDRPAAEDMAYAYRVDSLTESAGVCTAVISAINGTQAIRSLSYSVKNAPLMLSDMEVADGVIVDSISAAPDDKEIRLNMKLNLTSNIMMAITATYKAEVDASYNYSSDHLPNGHLIMTETLDVKGELSISGRITTIDQNVLEALAAIKSEQTQEKPLFSATLFLYGPISVKGNFSISISALLAGNLEYHEVRHRGVTFDGAQYEKTDSVVSKKEPVKFDVVGSLTVGVNAGIDMKVTGMGKVVSLSTGAGLTIKTADCPQYDEDIVCRDVELSMDAHLTLTVNLGVSLLDGFAGYNFVTKKIPLLKTTVPICTRHLEKYPGKLIDGVLWNEECRMLKECSIPQEERRVYEFYTGTMQKIDPIYSRIGQCIEPPAAECFSERISFLGWYTALLDGELYDFTIPPALGGDTTIMLYARWSQPMRKVTMKFGWDAMPDTEEYIVPGVAVKQPVVLMRMNYRCDGLYYTEGGISKKWDFNTMVMPEKDLILEAKWIYEEGYNPFEEIVDTYLGDEELMDQIISETTYTPTLSTAVQAVLTANGLSSPTTAVLNNFYTLSDYGGASSVLAVPGKVNGMPVTMVNGTNFTNKENLQVLILPDSVLHIEGFSDFPNLRCVIFGSEEVEFTDRNGDKQTFEGTLIIDKETFSNCPNLVEIVLPDSLKVLGSNAFANTALTHIALPNGLQKMGSSVFSGCANLRAAELPDSMTSLPDETFMNCSSLKTLNLPSTVVRLGEFCLYKSGIETLSVEQLAELGSFAIYGCENLKRFSADIHPSANVSISFSNLPALESVFLGGSIDTMSFKDYEGMSMPSLKNITIMGDVGYLDLHAFPALDTVLVGGNVHNLNLSDLPVLQSVTLEGMDIQDSYAIMTLVDCPKLDDLRVNSGVLPGEIDLSIENCGFRTLDLSMIKKPSDSERWNGDSIDVRYMPRMDRLILPDNITTIDDHAFEYNHALRDVSNLPDSITSIGFMAFGGCDNLETIVYPENALVPNGSPVYDCPALTSVTLPASLESISAESPYVENDSFRSKIRRLVISGSETVLETDFIHSNQLDDLFVVVAPENSAAHSAVISPYAERCWLPMSHADQYVVRYQPFGKMISGSAYAEYKYPDSERNIVFELYSEGETVKLPTLAVHAEDPANQVFTGWYLDENCTVPADGAMTMPGRDITLYGGWKENECTDILYQSADNGIIITGYTGSEEQLIIPAYINGRRVLTIADGAFAQSGVTSLVLPHTLSSLTPAAFDGCDSLVSVSISGERYTSSAGVVYALGDSGVAEELVFCPAGYAGELVIPDTVVRIGAKACSGCRGISAIRFPQSLVSIGSYAFSECYGLTEVHFPESLALLDPSAFLGCIQMTRASFASDVQLSEDSLPYGLDFAVFGPVGAENLTAWSAQSSVPYNMYRLTLTSGSTTFQREVQAGAPLSGFAPVNTETHIFMGWTDDAEMTGMTASGEDISLIANMPAADVTLYAVWQDAYTIENGSLLAVHTAMGADLAIPETVSTICTGAVGWDIERVYIPASVTMIEDGAFAGVGLVTGDAGSEAEAFAVREGIDFEQRVYTLSFNANQGSPCAPVSGVADEAITLPEPVRTQAEFMGWYWDEALTLPAEMTEMPAMDATLYAAWTLAPGYEMDFTFSYGNAQNVIISGYTGENVYPDLPDEINGFAVTAIASGAFGGNTAIERLDIPASVTSVGTNAFEGSALKSIVFLGENTVIGEGAFSSCAALAQVTLPAALESIPGKAFEGCSSLMAVDIPDTVSHIGAYAFSGCPFLKSITLPAALDAFEPSMLYGLNLTSIAVSGENKTLIAQDGALYSADGTELLYLCRGMGISSFDVPDGVTAIGEESLRDMGTLKAVTLPQGLVSIGSSALRNTAVSSVALPESLTQIGSHAFSGCGWLEEITLHSGITFIGDNAFDLSTVVHVPDNTCYAYKRLADEYEIIIDAGIDVTGVSLDSSLVLETGSTAVLTASVLPANADDRRIIWASSDSSVASVSGGTVMGVSAGTATIYAVASNGMSAACQVTVRDAGQGADGIVLDFSILKPSYQDADGRVYLFSGAYYDVTYDLTMNMAVDSFTLRDSGGKITYNDGRKWIYVPETIADGSVCTLTAEATDYNGNTYQKKVSVTISDRHTLELNHEYAEMYEGDTLWVIKPNEKENAISRLGRGLYSMDESILIIDEGGFVYAKAPGLAAVYYDVGSSSGSCLIRVLESECELSISIDDNVLFVGMPKEIHYTCSDPDAEVVLESLDPDILTIEDGWATLKSGEIPGIRATAVKDGRILAQATIYPSGGYPVTEIGLANKAHWSMGFMTVEPGEEVDLLESVSGSASTVLWSVSDPNVISISRNGVLTGINKGTATITGTRIYDGVNESVDVVVDVWDAALHVSAPSETIGVGQSVALDINVVPFDPSLTLKLYTEDYGYLTVDETGIVTGVSTGYERVYAELYNSSGYSINAYNRASVDMRVVSGVVATDIILPETMSVPLNQYTQVFNSTNLRPAGASVDTIQNVYFSEEDAKVASVFRFNSTYNVYITKPATVTLNVLLENGTLRTCRVTGEYPSVYSRINAFGDGQSSTLAKGASLQLDYDVHCVNDYTVKWSLPDGVGVLSVSSTGLIKGLKAGAERVQLTVTDKRTGASSSSALYVTVVDPVQASISEAVIFTEPWDSIYCPLDVSSSGVSLADLAGRIRILRDDLTPTGYTIQYGNPNNEWDCDKLYLYLSGISYGTYRYTIVLNNGVGAESVSAPLTIIASYNLDVADVELSPVVLAPGGTAQPSVTCRNSSGYTVMIEGLPVSWSVADTGVAIIDENGLLSAVASGTTTLTASVTIPSGVRTVSTDVTVLDSGWTSASFTQTAETVNSGSYFYLYWNVNPDDGRAYTLTSTDPNVAQISANGRVDGVSGGVCEIILSCGSGAQATCTVTVIQIPEKLVLNIPDETVMLPVGESMQIEASVLPDNADNCNVNWYSDDNTIASIDESGLLTGLHPGVTEITVRSEADYYLYETRTICVYEPIGDIVLTPNRLSLDIGKQIQLTANSRSGVLPNYMLTWSSSDENIATVTASGLVTRVGNGSAFITAETRDGSGRATASVVPSVSSQVSMRLPKAITTIEKEAFVNNTSLTSLWIGEKLQRIESRAFAGCTNLQYVIIESDCVTFAEDAFTECAEGFAVYCAADSETQTNAMSIGLVVIPL